MFYVGPFSQSNSPFSQSNSPFSQSNSPFSQSNSPFSQSSSLFSQSNIPFSQSSSLFSQSSSLFSCSNRILLLSKAPQPPQQQQTQQVLTGKCWVCPEQVVRETGRKASRHGDRPAAIRGHLIGPPYFLDDFGEQCQE
ncbi:unnamed protein product [Gadus morhua 'NCC']